MTGHYETLLLVEATIVALAGLLMLYTTLAHGEHILYPAVIGLLGGAFVTGGIGTAISVSGVPGGEPLTLGFISLAGLGCCLAGWRLTTSLLNSDQTIRIDSRPTEETGGFATNR